MSVLLWSVAAVVPGVLFSDYVDPFANQKPITPTKIMLASAIAAASQYYNAGALLASGWSPAYVIIAGFIQGSVVAGLLPFVWK